MENFPIQVLTPELSQTIVERTMEIVDYNINIMDQNGVIIGSGNQDRINNVHECAQRVIESGVTKRVYQQEESELTGTKFGINMPIQFNGEVIGVVGITGDPDEVESYAGLVKMTVELMVQQAGYLEQEQLQEQAEEHFIKELLNNEVTIDLETMFQRAQEIGFNLEQPYRIFILKIYNLWEKLLQYAQEENNTKLHYYKKQIKLEVQNFFVSSEDTKVCYWKGEKFIILECEIEEYTDDDLISLGEDLLARLEQSLGFIAELGIGNKQNGLKGIKNSFSSAVDALELGEKYNETSDVYYIKDLILENLIHDLSKERRAKLASQFPLPEKYQQTLQVYFSNNLNISETARELFLHRNSILYRLDKIKEVTGLDPKKFNDAIQLKFGLLCQQYF
ncbi:MAG: CdaR family transcriptional regulator [Bacillota bacterium]